MSKYEYTLSRSICRVGAGSLRELTGAQGQQCFLPYL